MGAGTHFPFLLGSDRVREIAASSPSEISAMSDRDLEQYRSALLLLARAQLARQRLADVDASDLVQQSLLEAHRDGPHFTGRTAEERFAWLRKILHHNFLDACAKARAAKGDIARKVLEADLTASFVGLDELLVAAQSSPSERAMRNEQLTRLAEALEQLPEQQREAVLLRHIVGLTLREVGERMQCTPAATAGLLYRGRQRLQEILGEN
jgi:RNA polymerase sigma-70 factor (ECF subfamily)